MPLLKSPSSSNRSRNSRRTAAANSSPQTNRCVKALYTKAAVQISNEKESEKDYYSDSSSRTKRSTSVMFGPQDSANESRTCKQEFPELDEALKHNKNSESDIKTQLKSELNGVRSMKRNISPCKEKSTMSEAEMRQNSSVTPTKQKRRNENDEAFKSPYTPSRLLDKLSLKSPNEEPKFEPKKLFADGNVYQNARRALHSTNPSRMPGRESELNELRGFIETHSSAKKSGALYISGPPGTGKTALLSMILNDSDVASKFKQVYINCTAVKSSGSIFSRIIKELDCKTTGKSEKECIVNIESYLSKSHKMILLVLDEIDQLESKKQSILYKIFEWPSKPDSNIILIGIANALDLTDRILPRLQARCELKPQLMHFAPYTKAQIIQIFTERLRQSGVLDVFSPAAIQMLAGKVAAISGDVRRALDIGRRVIELVEQDNKSEVLKSLENLAEGETSKSEPKHVDLLQVVKILNKVYGTTNNLNESGDESFPLQQKIVMCSLLLILKKHKNKDVTIGKLHEVYRKVCGKRNLLAIDQAEFVGICSLIETKGIINVAGKREPRLHKVCLNWDQDEVAAALKDKQLMSSILQDDDCLGKL